ncbi:MAG: DUF2207 domain-containing protein, partial [Thermodesulfobacteriota bacterium]
MRNLSLFLLLLISTLLIASSVSAEEIRNFNSNIYINNDGTINVQENIEYDFGNALRHGIYRDIPYKYNLGYKNYNTRLDVLNVTNFKGEPYIYEVTKSGGWVNIRIGDPDRKVTGIHSYRIEYRVRGAITFFDDHDELYWNVTGDEWRVPILSSIANVKFGQDITNGVKAACYTGPGWSESKDCEYEIDTAGVQFKTLSSLSGGEGLTIVVGVPKGIIQEPSSLSKFLWFLSDNWAFALPFATFFALFHIWRKRGRDPEAKGVIAVKYEPPENITPAEAGTLIDERANILDLTSTVIDLAVRGYLTIEEITTTKFFYFTNKDYKIIRTQKPLDSIKLYEDRIISGMFGGKDTIMVSELKNKFYSHIPGIKDALYKELVAGRYFPTNPENVRRI